MRNKRAQEMANGLWHGLINNVGTQLSKMSSSNLQRDFAAGVLFKVDNRSKNISTKGQSPFVSNETKLIGKFLVNSHATWSGSVFPVRVRIRIQDSQINADPFGSAFTTLQKRQYIRYQALLMFRVGIKKPTQKTQKKNYLKKPTKNGFLGFLGFLNF